MSTVPKPVRRIIAETADAINELGIPVTRLCHFGSSVHKPGASDIDVIVTVETPKNALTFDYTEQLNAVRERMKGNLAIDPPTDPYVESFSSKVVECIQHVSQLPVVAAFGPAPHFRDDLPRIHLNGPVTDRFCELYGAAFPIHSWVIRNNSICHVGDLPPAGTIDHESVREYLALMQQRIVSTAPLKVLRKLVQTLGLLAGKTSCLPEVLASQIFSHDDPFSLCIRRELHAETATTQTCDYCIRLLDIHADVMADMCMTYPAHWTSTR